MNKTAKQKNSLTLLETWAENFGSFQERQGERRTIHFNEQLDDMADQVNYSLEVLPELMDLAATSGWGEAKANGFDYLTQITIDAAQQTIRALQDDNKALSKENDALKKAAGNQDATEFLSSNISLSTDFAADVNQLVIDHWRRYGGGKSQALGVILVDMLRPEDREEMIGMLAAGASTEQIKARAVQLVTERKTTEPSLS